jgi:hypothetical protein
MKFHPIMFCSHSFSINNWSNVCTVTQKFWTLFQCIGTKIFGPCSSAQGRKFLDPVPVHRDENFWTLFQCTGTKNFGRCSCAKKRKYFGSFNDEHFSFIQWWECHFIFRFHWETKLSTMRRQSSLQWYVPKVTQPQLPAARENSFTHHRHLEQRECISVVTYNEPSHLDAQQKMMSRENEM